MDNISIKMIRQEIASLREKVNFLQRELDAMKNTHVNDHKHMLDYISDRLLDLHPYIFPTFHKVFPKFTDTFRDINAILKTDRPHEDDKKS